MRGRWDGRVRKSKPIAGKSKRRLLGSPGATFHENDFAAVHVDRTCV